MNRKLALLVLAQGLFLTNNICFMAINGLVGLALAPRPWMATLPICAYVTGGALMARLVGRHQLRFGRRRAFQIGLGVALASCALALWSVLHQQFWGVVTATLIAGYYTANAGKTLLPWIKSAAGKAAGFSPAEYDYWYGGKPAARDLPGITGQLDNKKGTKREGGSITQRVCKYATWNSFGSESVYLTKRANDFLSA